MRRIVIALVLVAVAATPAAARPFDDAEVKISPAEVRAGGMVSIAVTCGDGSRSAILAGSGYAGSVGLPRSRSGRWRLKAHIPADMDRGEHLIAVRCGKGGMGFGLHRVRGGAIDGPAVNRIADHIHYRGGPHTGFGGLSR